MKKGGFRNQARRQQIRNKQKFNFIVLKKNSDLPLHVDPECALRYHLSLQCEKDKSEMNGENINVGESYLLDTSKLHSVSNNSFTTDRIHFVIDYVEDKKADDKYKDVVSKIYKSDEHIMLNSFKKDEHEDCTVSVLSFGSDKYVKMAMIDWKK